MSQLVDVATWVGLIAGLVGITLSIVAIWFTFTVESRSRRVTEQMIRSLQKIETFVERSSADTQGLIKVGWDRMLGNASSLSPRPSDEASESAIKQMAGGLAEEVRAELSPHEDSGAEGAIIENSINEDRIVERVSEAIQAQLRAGRRQGQQIRQSDRIEELAQMFSRVSPLAYELVRFLSGRGHLTRIQYRTLARDSRFGNAIRELRDAGILVPLLGEGVPKRDQPVYWLPGGDVNNLRIAFELLGRRYPEEREEVGQKLRQVGYIRPIEKSSELKARRPAIGGTGSGDADKETRD